MNGGVTIPKVGFAVDYVDAQGRVHEAFPVKVFEPVGTSPPQLNLVYVSGHDTQEDDHGNQMKRGRLVPHWRDRPMDSKVDCWCTRISGQSKLPHGE